MIHRCAELFPKSCSRFRGSSVVLVGLAEAVVYGRFVSNEVKNRNFAYAISIMKHSQVHCAGILVKLEWTLTACSCVGYFFHRKFREYRIDTIVLIGGTIENVVTSHNYERVQLRKATDVVHHPNCSEGRGGQVWGHDFGMYESEKFELKKELRPAHLHPEDRLRDMILLWVSLEAVCETIGWGMTVINFTTQYFKPSNTLKVADVHLMDWGECGLKLCQQPLSICDEKIYGLGKLCAMNINGSDSCDKDEGGKQFVRGARH
ncbi:hypothetical protein GE061_015861 [Apolygus lucorum]|uniref:Peptidase S1 domain-containing protein n=1 Tax=Apolygus lucorum TaxID=248454 RepID=A0A8S9XR99_APOLU|nr:hypothetical protein GE061_015861 [Apolygus lucorum]